MAPSKYVGVDGCKGGWFSVGLDHSGGFREAKVFKTFAELLKYYEDAELILVDIPIGLPDGPQERECDPIARGKLDKQLKRSVFRAPTRHTMRYVYEAQSPVDHAEASQVEQKYAAKRGRTQKPAGISKQAFNIIPKIGEVDEVLLSPRRTPKPCVREIHPELCFWALNSGKKPLKSKHSLQGKVTRLSVLQSVDCRAAQIFEKACSWVCSPHDKDVSDIDVAFDDILDALVAAVTAYKSGGEPCSFPKTPQCDPKYPQLRMEMVYWKPG